jgi:hypothetical protein
MIKIVQRSGYFSAALLMTILVMLSACNTYKTLDGRRIPRIEADELWNVLDTGRLEYNLLSARIKLDFQDALGKQSGIALVHMQKDSLIWISLRKAGLEGARILISPDSLKILDRQAKIYVNVPYSTLQEGYGINVAFSRLQELIVGDPPVGSEVLSDELGTGLDEDRYLLQLSDGEYLSKIWFRTESLLMDAAKVADRQGNEMTIHYDGWSSVQGQAFPLNRQMVFSGGEFAELSVEFSRVELDPGNLTFAYGVNPKYREVNSLEDLDQQ